MEPLCHLGLHYPEAAVVDPETGHRLHHVRSYPVWHVPIHPATRPATSRAPVASRCSRSPGFTEPGVGYDTRTGQQVGVTLPVTWVDIDDPSNEAAYRADALYTYKQGLAKGGATFVRGEGAVYSRNSVFFATTNGGDAGLGQIFELHLKNNDVQELELIFESTDEAAMAAPDNICISRLNNNLIICEDGGGAEYLHLLRRSGNQVYRLAENLYPGQTGSEWAGACFSPDGQTLFANIYTPGAVLAIWTDRWGTIN